jgi:Fur family zinc uptake transcriptional regulator
VNHALGAYDVLQKLSDDGLADKPPMAYRALNFLVEHGFAHRVERLNAYVACAHPDAEHTPALWICSDCHKVAETAQAAELGQRLGQDGGFSINTLTIEAEGSCLQCRGESSND